MTLCGLPVRSAPNSELAIALVKATRVIVSGPWIFYETGNGNVYTDFNRADEVDADSPRD